jgi:methionyl-tRNA formyltransferase
MALRIVFMGTAELACASLKALINAPDFELAGVVTQPDRPRGRDLKLQPTPVKQVALEAGLPVWQPLRARHSGFISQLAGLRLDMLVVAAYGQILPQAMLDLPRFGGINVHTSLLPKYRGAAPIQWAMLNDEPETGVTIMRMAASLDTGDILSQRSTPILAEDNAATLHDRLAALGAELLVPTIRDFAGGRIVPRPQVESEATYARKIAKEDGRLEWTAAARVLWNRIRAFTPWPGAFTTVPGINRPRLLKVIRAMVVAGRGDPGVILQADKGGLVVACGHGALQVVEVQLEGGRKMTATELLAGHALPAGTKLG